MSQSSTSTLFRRVVVVDDGAASIVPVAEQLAPYIEQSDGQALLVRLVDFRVGGIIYHGTHPEQPAMVEARLREHDQRELDRDGHRLRERGVRARGTLVDAPKQSGVAKLAQSEKATLVAVPHRAGLRSLLRSTGLPLWLCSRASNTDIERIVMPVAAGDDGHLLEPFVMGVAWALGCPVTLLHAVARGQGGPTKVRVRAELELVAERFRSTGVEAEVVLRTGGKAEVIAEFASGDSAFLIVLATHDHPALRRWLFGSITDAVLRSAASSVIVVRADERLSSVTHAAENVVDSAVWG